MIIMIILIFWIAVDVVYGTESEQLWRAFKNHFACTIQYFIQILGR